VITVYFAKFDDQNLADMAVDSFHFQLQWNQNISFSELQ
jgi:hypothetical protein